MTRAKRTAGAAMGEPRRRGLGRRVGLWGAVLGLAMTLGGCSLDSLLNNDELPPEVTDPAITQTPAGALAVYHGTILQLQVAFGGIFGSSFSSGANRIDPNPSFIALSGLFSDELQQPSGTAVNTVLPVNARSLFSLGPTSDDPSVEDAYSSLQRTRAQAGQAAALLQQYQPEQPALAGHMYAVEAYTEIMLAELFCSGIPLSTLDFGGDYTLRPGSRTADVFTHALALLDTGATLAADSARIMNLIHVGQGRAMLALGQYAEAAAAVAGVPDDYTYNVKYGLTSNLGTTDGHDERNFAADWANGSLTYWGGLSVANREGINGLDYISSGDPRTASTQVNNSGFSGYRANKYTINGGSPIVLASGVEARLIEAEAALQAGDVPAWLETLDRLRSAGETTVPEDTIVDTLGVSGCGGGAGLCGHGPGGDDPVEFGQPLGGFQVPSGYNLVDVDTTYPAPTGVGGGGGLCDQRSWYRPCYAGDSMVVYVYVQPEHTETGPGTGGVSGLGTLTDPGTADGRVDLMFHERAFWLFLTGHRQGDMRRLIRQYGRHQDEVYPRGPYPVLGNLYGTDVVLPIPTAEKISNPQFTGCASTGA